VTRASSAGAMHVLNLDLSKSVLEWSKANYRAGAFTGEHDGRIFRRRRGVDLNNNASASRRAG
jgi:hypothetical protein